MSKKMINILLIVIMLFTLIMLIFPKTTYISVNSKAVNSDSIVGTNNTEIGQEINITDNYNKIGFLLSSNLSYIENGNIVINIYQNNKLKKQKKIKANSIIDDNYYYKYYYVNYKFKKGNQYKIVITFDNLSNPISIMTTEDSKFSGNLYVDNVLNNKVLSLSFLKSDTKRSYLWYSILLICVILSYKTIKFEE